MPSLPRLDAKKNINRSPHVVILGAGASLAAFPHGDRFDQRLPLMRNLVEVVGLEGLLNSNGVSTPIGDFESFYDELVTNAPDALLVQEIENQIHGYFSGMALPDEATLYDYLLLSLREKDLIATFNWDPFLAQAYDRNRHIGKLPKMVFLHGNVQIGVCREHRLTGFLWTVCPHCSKPFTASRLLCPVKHKDYASDPFIENEWRVLQRFLREAYFITIFGYSAPSTDVEAKRLMLDAWAHNPSATLAEIEIVDIRREGDLQATWQDFLNERHHSFHSKLTETYAFRHPRRTCDAFAMATLQQRPWHDNSMPLDKDLKRMHRWLAPLVREEEVDYFSGKPCDAPE